MGVQTNKKYRQGYITTETIVDGDIYKITEEYKDDEGNVVYIYEYYPTTGELMKEHKNKNKQAPKKQMKGKKRR